MGGVGLAGLVPDRSPANRHCGRGIEGLPSCVHRPRCRFTASLSAGSCCASGSRQAPDHEADTMTGG